ncbi:potassium:chloride symporter [Malassezia pachydermatis]|uniref:Solute carrier family 12 member 3 n=1 Tax=Malassezia pachydermatis TaxID=77020 RepID=A0A0N0RS15_9BASI|nr:solute carrier family 12 member 3 [Malassezia pachydermatis]KOS13345.1 solute carrier family 12 member 3 [Malassezia pachydermatis]
MSRFISADEADYASLQEQLLRRSTDQESDDAHADPAAVQDTSAVAAESATPSKAPSLHRRNSDNSQVAPPTSNATPTKKSGLPDEATAAAVLHGRSQSRAPGGLSGAPLGEPAVRKLGTWDGVFMPVTLNVLGIILFLRFGFILGQAGLLGALLLLVISYAIDTLTVLSLNAISTNGQVRGGGAYYLISRSLGPEFGGSIGLIFFFGQAFNAAMNILGFVESFVGVFGESAASGLFPEGSWFLYLYGTVVLWLCTLVCLFGSSLFTRATLLLAVILSFAVISIPLSSFLVEPMEDAARDVYYTGWSWMTLSENLWPHFTSGAAGSSTAPKRENWWTVFGVLFPAVCGILAGASMSGDLRKPSKSIPKGTNWSLIFTFGLYVVTFVIMACTVSRESFYLNVSILGDVSYWPIVIVLGELASCGFSALMGVMACAKVLQAIARDDLLPFLAPFAQGTLHGDIPTYAVLFTAVLCQAVLLMDSINLIAQFVTMTTLLTFGVLSAATMALKAGGAPSFRPSFRYWNIWTAGAGTVMSLGAMILTDAYTAAFCIAITVILFIMIQVFSPPKPWGDVSHNVTYHFVRKYLLRLDERKGHVKYWRPQILLLANNPRTEWNLIIFCNSLKKGALYILGHVLKGEFQECLPELRQCHLAWLKLVDVSRIKGFVDVVIARDEREGARNLFLSCGLGGMKPNIVVLGFPSVLQRPSELRRGPISRATQAGTSKLSTEAAPVASPIRCATYVGILEDALALNKALAVAYGFDAMDLPGPSKVAQYERTDSDQYIDLWPIQIAHNTQTDTPTWDTYTMVLQLGTILSLTGTWKRHKLRVSVFVEHPNEIDAERTRVRTLLDNLRIPASLRVFCLSAGHVPRYDAIVQGKRALDDESSRTLKNDSWWQHVCDMRQAQEQSKLGRSEPINASSSSASRRASTDSLSSQSARRKNTRQFGVSLPEEHLAFHYNNIRLGLAHPRSHDLSDSDSEMDDMDDDVSLRDDLEAELASLAVDWDPKYLINPKRAQRRERERLQGDSSVSTSYGTLSSSQRTVTPATVQTDSRRRGRKSTTSPLISSASTSPLRSPTEPPTPRRVRTLPPPAIDPIALDHFALSFNDLPNLAQYLILNELIRNHSSRSTSVVLTALPAPVPGTSSNEGDSQAYLLQLRTLYGGGPPILGVHATTLTMTMML